MDFDLTEHKRLPQILLTDAPEDRLCRLSGRQRRADLSPCLQNRLLRAYATQLEALRRLRNGGLQFVRVEHVHLKEGGQAVVGNVKSPASKPARSSSPCR